MKTQNEIYSLSLFFIFSFKEKNKKIFFFKAYFYYGEARCTTPLATWNIFVLGTIILSLWQIFLSIIFFFKCKAFPAYNCVSETQNTNIKCFSVHLLFSFLVLYQFWNLYLQLLIKQKYFQPRMSWMQVDANEFPLTPSIRIFH